MDLPRFSAGGGESFARAAVFCRPWQRILLSSSVTSEGYALRTSLDRPARTGRLTSPLTKGVSGRFNRGTAIELDLFFGGLSSATHAAVLAGENRLAIRAANGAWEVLGFAEAEEIAPDRWRLSILLRGLAGTEDAMMAGAATGAPIVLLDEAVVALGLTVEERGRNLNWVAEGTSASGGRIGPFAFAGGTRAETPLSPVHLRGLRRPDGWHLSWTRRSRIEADDWDAADIPLDEPEERYRLEILDGAEAKRTVDLAEPRHVYTEAQELTDFGAPQPSLTIRVRQLGRAVPLGLPAIATVST
ncbi:GTA baseplate fiber-binding domain-containing protein [Pseudorhizobium xiangyangii]